MVKEELYMNDQVMRNLSYGLFVLTAKDGEKDNGCIINTVCQVASEPNTISISVNKQNFTCEMIRKTGCFNVSILSENAKFPTFQHFGFQSGRDTDKMKSIAFSRAANGVAYLDGDEVNAFISGRVLHSIDLGSHMLFIAAVTDGEILHSDPSATYSFYFTHIKPKPEAKPAAKKGWICTICGYIYEGEILPDDFICPVCKHPASDFKKLE